MKTQNNDELILYTTIIGIFAGLLSSFSAYGYTGLALKIRHYIEFREGKRQQAKKISRRVVKQRIAEGFYINMIGVCFTLVGLQAWLLSMTIGNNLFVSTTSGSYVARKSLLLFDIYLL